MSTPTSSLLSIKDLSVEYHRRGQRVQAVRSMSLDIAPGQAVGLVGESGCGKSTVALSILRLIRPNEGRISSGRIDFEGRDLLQLSEEEMRRVRGRRIAMIFQDPFTALNPVLRVRTQMAEMPSLDGVDWTEQQLEEALDRVRLEPRRVLDSYPHQLSGGQRQRVLIATALLAQPAVLLADEPTTALDVLVQKEILDLLFQLQRDAKVGMLFISHNLAVVARYCQRVAVMKEGAIVEENTSINLVTAPENAYTRDLLSAVPRLPSRGFDPTSLK